MPSHNDTAATATTGALQFLQAIYDSGVRYCFVNLGSDHPALVEAIANIRRNNTPGKAPEIITCPSELVALSAALGYAQVTGVPQCVIVHVDCGTLALGQSLHNASVARVPVLMFAGLTPVTQEGELQGSRTEFIHWIQDVPDQVAIVRQYCRYTAECRRAHNIKQVVNRALQIARSDPKGPVYLMASRETLEEVAPTVNIDQERWNPIVSSSLPDSDVAMIGDALIRANRPLVITGYSGRNVKVPDLLAALCDTLPIEVVETVGSDLCLSSAHEAYRGMTITTHPRVVEADVILILDCDVPWVPVDGKPSESAKIYHLDVDPLKTQMYLTHVGPHWRYKVSCENALRQLISYISSQHLDSSKYAEQFKARADKYREWRAIGDSLEKTDDVIRVPYLMSHLRQLVPENTTFVLEAVTNAGQVIRHLKLTRPGSFLGTGAGGLGWLGGATLGIKLAKPDDFVCGIVGDGTFLFSQMESVFWISRRYEIPFLIIVLNNSGWNAPKVSTLLVHKSGEASKTTRKDLGMSFEPSPAYGGIAAAAGGAWSGTISECSQVRSVLEEAINKVKNKQSAVVEVKVPSMWPETPGAPTVKL